MPRELLSSLGKLKTKVVAMEIRKRIRHRYFEKEIDVVRTMSYKEMRSS